MYVIVAGGGKIGENVTRSLLRLGHEVTLIEQKRDRFERLEDEFEHQVQRGDATELHVLERAGIARPPDIVLALTGDDEDNLVIAQLAKEKYGVEQVIARVNDPRNQAHFDLLGISPTVCATSSIMALVEHEVPEHDLIHLLELRKENLEIVEAAEEAGVDLIVLGSSPRWRRQSRFFSPTVDYVLRKSPAEVLIVAFPQGSLEEPSGATLQPG